MTRLEFILQRARKCDFTLNSMLFEHGDDEHLKAAVEASASLIWNLEQIVGPGTACAEAEPDAEGGVG